MEKLALILVVVVVVASIGFRVIDLFALEDKSLVGLLNFDIIRTCIRSSDTFTLKELDDGANIQVYDKNIWYCEHNGYRSTLFSCVRGFVRGTTTKDALYFRQLIKESRKDEKLKQLERDKRKSNDQNKLLEKIRSSEKVS